MSACTQTLLLDVKTGHRKIVRVYVELGRENLKGDIYLSNASPTDQKETHYEISGRLILNAFDRISVFLSKQ